MSERKIIIERDAFELAKRGAQIFSQTAEESVNRYGRFAVALSGGSTPRPMHRLLSEEPYAPKIPWGSINIFWTDERVLPFEDPESNFGVAQRDFLDKLTIPSAQVHPMPVWITPERGAALYQEELEGFFQRLGSDDPAFDLIFLGIGKDGHIASLFPAQEALDERKRWVVAVKGGIPYVSRLTMTYSIINHARQIVFLVSGGEKSEILRNIFEEKQLGLPVQKIQPLGGKLTWLLDQDAASLLVV
jgi:6-phosphogluconolactonase